MNEGDTDLPPVQLVDKWDGPRTYAEDFYAGGDLPPDVARLRTPSHLTPAHTPRAETDDMAEFLTPGVLTPKSPPAELASDTDVEEADVGAPPREDVSTFSMPPESEERSEPLVVEAEEQLQDDSALEDLYADLGDEPLPEAAQMIPPTPATPVTDPTAAVLDLHEHGSDAQLVSFKEHIDWSDRPAFSSGRPASSPGYLKSVDIAVSEERPERAPAAASVELSPEQEILEISDDEDELGIDGPIPLGTSDLDIPMDATYDEDEAAEDDFALPADLSPDFIPELAQFLNGVQLPTGGASVY